MIKYIGDGWLHGVPARDLTDEEVAVYGKKRLLDSGWYKEVKNHTEKEEVKNGNQSITKNTVGR